MELSTWQTNNEVNKKKFKEIKYFDSIILVIFIIIYRHLININLLRQAWN